MTKDQAKHLEARLQAAFYPLLDVIEKERMLKPSVEVTRAMAIVQKYGNENEKRRRMGELEARRLVSDAREAIVIFGDAEKALTMIKKLEKKSGL